MSDNGDRKDIEDGEQDFTEGLYHEAQADGVPYDEDLEPSPKNCRNSTSLEAEPDPALRSIPPGLSRLALPADNVCLRAFHKVHWYNST